LRPLIGLVLVCIMNRNEYRVIGKNIIFKTFMNLLCWYRQIDKLTFDLGQVLDRLLSSHAPEKTVVRMFALWRVFKGEL